MGRSMENDSFTYDKVDPEEIIRKLKEILSYLQQNEKKFTSSSISRN